MNVFLLLHRGMSSFIWVFRSCLKSVVPVVAVGYGMNILNRLWHQNRVSYALYET
jgi:hypothetical protein